MHKLKQENQGKMVRGNQRIGGNLKKVFEKLEKFEKSTPYPERILPHTNTKEPGHIIICKFSS